MAAIWWEVNGNPAFKHIHNSLHAGPHLPLVLDAAQRHLEHGHHRRLVIVRRRHGRVHGPQDLAPRHLLPHDVREVVSREVRRLQRGIHVPAAADELEERHAVAEHVGLVGHGVVEHLGRHVPEGALEVLCVDDAVEVPSDGEGDAEVGDVCPEVAVEEDVARLDVEVQDPPVALVVEVRERPGHVDGDGEPLGPGQLAPLLLGAVEDPPVKRAVLEEGVDKVEAAPALEAVAEEAHQAAVVRVCDDGELPPEVLLAGDGAPAVDVDPLDGDGRAVVEAPPEDLGRAASPYHASKVLCHGLDFITREFPQHLLDMNRGSKLGLMMKHCFFLPCRITIRSIKPSSELTERRIEFPEAIRGYSQDIGRENEADAKTTLGKRGKEEDKQKNYKKSSGDNLLLLTRGAADV